jgi:hypothetical protein
MKVLLAIVLVLCLSISTSAVDAASGDWTAVIKVRDIDLRLALHITDSGNGLKATFDSIDQKVMGMPVDKIEVKDQQVKFEINVIEASYAGTLNKSGTVITGAWSQLGMSFPVNFQKTAQAKK